MRYTICFILLVFAGVTSCKKNDIKNESENNSKVEVSNDSVIKNGNSIITYSTDIKKLGKLINLKNYKPTRVKFKYFTIDNSSQNSRVSVPGPSDYSLEVLMYFDSITFKKFYAFDKTADYSSPNYDVEEFKFDWLDKETLLELENSDKNYHGHPDFFFETNNGQSWYLENKILLKVSSN